MAEGAIKSRPVYGVLTAQAGREHLLIADGQGAEAILDLAKAVPDGFFAVAQIVYVGDDLAGKLQALNPARYYQAPTIAAALPHLGQTFATARMGLKVYLTGTEGLIGQAMLVALKAGIDHSSIVTEQRGSLERRVQCVHCKGITEGVTTQPATCGHCGKLLFIRDHYSRRIAAFQGVCINAEDPSDVPQKVETYR